MLRLNPRRLHQDIGSAPGEEQVTPTVRVTLVPTRIEPNAIFITPSVETADA